MLSVYNTIYISAKLNLILIFVKKLQCFNYLINGTKTIS